MNTDSSSSPTRAAASASAPLRVAVVGAGPMGRHHIRAIQALGGSSIVAAIVDADAAALDAAQALAPGAARYADLTSLLQGDLPDIVHVCTPPATHEAVATQALQAGAHVYVEKPVAETRAAVERLIALAEQRGRLLCAGHQLLHEHPAREALRLLPAIGQLVHVESYFSFRPVRRAGPGRKLMRADHQLLDILPHPVYLLLDMLERAVPGGETRISAIELGEAGTVHALIARGTVNATLIVTLEGRPIENTLRLTGTQGSITADFVRGSTVSMLGPGANAIAKVLHPYSVARQLVTGATRALARRVANRQKSYLGLTALIGEFHRAVATGAAEPPLSYDGIRSTVTICERIADRIAALAPRAGTGVRPESAARLVDGSPLVVVTGGTGFLGARTVRWLQAFGASVRVLARREPAPWERLADVEYRVVDVASPLPDDALRGAEVVVHCAAATSGGYDEHQRHSVDATEHVLRAALAAGIRRVVHVSSLGIVVGTPPATAISEETLVGPPSRGFGPYVWGKAESERVAIELGRSLGLDVRVVRPGAIVDFERFDPPGRLGRRIGNTFVAVGRSDEQLGVVGLDEAGRTLAWLALRFEEAPPMLHLLSPRLPTRADLVERLRRDNPQLRVRWIRPAPLAILSIGARMLQRVLRPSRQAIDVAKVFAAQRNDTSRIAALTVRMNEDLARASATAPASVDEPVVPSSATGWRDATVGLSRREAARS